MPQPNNPKAPNKSYSLTWLMIPLALGFVVLALYAGYLYHLTQNEPEIDVLTREGVITQIQEMSRLQTVAYQIDTIISTKKAGNWYTLWQDEQKGLFVAHGKVLAGVDLNQITVDNVTVTPKQVDEQGEPIVTSDADLQIDIVLPPAQVFEVFLQDIEVYDIQTGLFGIAPSDKEMFKQAQMLGKQEVLAKACQGGVIDMATANAQKQIAGLFAMTGASVTVEISENSKLSEDGDGVFCP